MGEPNFDLRTAKGMQEYCDYYEMGRGSSRGWALKHFGLIADDLRPDEDVLTVFIGISNYESMTKHENNAAYAVTSKRIIVAQKNLIGKSIVSVALTHVNDVKLKTGLLGGIVTFDAMSETFNVFLYKEFAQRVFDNARDCIDYAKKQTAQPVAQKEQQSASSISDLRELNELLKDGIITQAEFDAKKKQILGI